MKRKTLKLVALPAIVGASLVGGFAAAVFTLTGSVEADGEVATPVSPTATAHIDDLWPGECSDVSVTFTNDNAHAVVIDTIGGRITEQPSTGDHGQGKDQGGGNDPVVWRGSSQALAGEEIPPDDSETFTIPAAVCLTSKAGDEVAGEDVAASITFGFHVPAGDDYSG